MLRDPSQPSIVSSSAAVSEPSAFERELPNSVESLAVELPRGLKTPGSVRLAGQMGSEVKVPTRKYNVTVEPRGRAKKPKDAMRVSSKPLSDIEMDVERHRVGDPAVDGLVDDRFAFRHERQKRFQIGSHFPALVSPRLVPSWHLSAAGRSVAAQGGAQLSPASAQAQATPRSLASAAVSSGQPGSGSTLSKPTVSHSRKQTQKRPPDSEPPWLASGATGARDLICDRKPALHSEHYDAPRVCHREDHEFQKELWVSDTTMLPASSAEAKAGFDASRPQLESHIAAMRERGRAFNESLRERYDSLRENFQRERSNMIEKQRGLSSFEMAMKEKEQAEAAAQASAAAHAKASEPKKEEKHRFKSQLGGFFPGRTP